jgi:hypothetical protein
VASEDEEPWVVAWASMTPWESIDAPGGKTDTVSKNNSRDAETCAFQVPRLNRLPLRSEEQQVI